MDKRDAGDDDLLGDYDEFELIDSPPPPMSGPAGRLIKSSAEFVRGFEPPEYLLDGIIQGGFLYSQTGSTGDGKTAIALEIARCVAEGAPICGREVEPGHVVYFAGENPDDVRQRWIAMAEHVPFDVERIRVSFLDGVSDLIELEKQLKAEIDALGGARLIVIDTSAAFFLGEDENSNPAMGAYARRLRRFTAARGNPTVLVNCHPIKNASADNLLPRGGGAFLAEVDGNLTCSRREGTVTVHWQGKHRGADFEPMSFEMKSATARRLVTRKGKPISTVYAAQLSEFETLQRAHADQELKTKLLGFLSAAEGHPSVADIAKAIGLTRAGKDGKEEAQKSTAHRLLRRLEKEHLLTRDGGVWSVTKQGRKLTEATTKTSLQ
jgi:hypothetical protein